jgi:hypothetical protein
MRKDLERELIKQVTIWTGREAYWWELVIAWFQIKYRNYDEVLAALVEINEMLYYYNLCYGKKI